MSYPSFITLPFKHERDAPHFETNFIKSPESLARWVLKEFTKKGDKVFDPFSGLGTTLFVAEEMGRTPFGVEAEESRHQWVAGQLENWMHLVHGDSAKSANYGFPKMDFCFTSPPYMQVNHQWNPLYAGDPKHAGYEKYLKRMGIIFAAVAKVMKKNAYVVIQVDNLPGKIYTPLVRDLSLVVSKHLRLDGEITVAWKNPQKAYLHSQCLVFKNA